jgi:hypothetical protein
MASPLMGKVQDVYLKTISILALKKLISPFVRVGSVYFFERDLSTELPPLRPASGVIFRRASYSDLPLLDATTGASRRKVQAEQRLSQDHLWFVVIEEATGRLLNYRWVSTTTAFIPELNRELIVGPKQAYSYDLYTLPEFRRRGIEGFSRQSLYTHLYRDCGVERVVAYICADNYASLQACRRYLTRVGRVWHAQCGRGETRLFMRLRKRIPELRPVPSSPAEDLRPAPIAYACVSVAAGENDNAAKQTKVARPGG